ncbi:alpha/beta fold hydrolase [Aestuariibacter sp. A3R04]|uniref:alpha/beta fold hydrolase n=1 Tax=Aestuariibacter sp. A3R04 TaxID=2841571 RepID=UPI001C089DE0|nr:alpha/beta hydrolase [Aestuariibacter sp. A3R04]MBU3022674.1 alpha/beta hydrolase [Aestuariibacter sp. A3R04]
MPIVHFAHANGFPAQSYAALFDALPKTWTVLAKPKFGHHPNYTVAGNWTQQVEELAHFLADQVNNEPVWLVGHSFGAVLSFMMACRYPHRVLGLIMLDPPIVYGFSRHVVKLAKLFGMMDKITPSKLAKIRRTCWSKHDNVEAYFAVKPLFKNMDKRCIRDYIKSATSIEGDDRKLTFKRDIEADIFRHFPHNLHTFKGRLHCPALLVQAKQSSVTKEADLRKFLRDNSITRTFFDGGHMFPLEQPERVADVISATLRTWEQSYR